MYIKRPKYTSTSQTTKKGVLKRPPAHPFTPPPLPPSLLIPQRYDREKNKRNYSSSPFQRVSLPETQIKHLAMHSWLEDFICPKPARFRNAEATSRKRVKKSFTGSSCWCECVCVCVMRALSRREREKILEMFVPPFSMSLRLPPTARLPPES